MVVRLLKWVAVLMLPKILKTTDKPANAILEEYRAVAGEVLSECKTTSKEMASESVAVSAEMAKVEAWKLIVKNNETIRLAIVGTLFAMIALGIMLGGLIVLVIGVVYGLSELLAGVKAWYVFAGSGAILGLLPILLAWLFVFRRGAWINILLGQVRKVRYADKDE